MPRLGHGLIIVTSAIVFAGAAYAQNHPDFTGTWTVDRVDAQERLNPSGGGFRGGGGGGGGRGGFGRRGGFGGRGRNSGGGGRPEGGRSARSADAAGLSQGDTLRITQTADRLIVTRQSSDGQVMTSYTLDGKETKNRPAPDVEIKTKTKWEGVALVTDGTRTFASDRGGVSVKTREVLSVSEDGQTLTSSLTADSPRGKQTIVATLSRAH